MVTRLQHPSISQLKNKKGFTLIEMAIVLVIIGIIIGAVVKGQDLVENAKSKQFSSKIQAWQIAINTYYDRKGRLPGDADRNGIVGEAADIASFTPQADIDAAQFSSPPEKQFNVGGITFYAFLGSDATNKKNYLLVCKDATCNTAFAPTDSNDLLALKFFEAFDTAIDGTSDAGQGTVRGATAASIVSATSSTVAVMTTANTEWLTSSTIKAMALQIK